VLRSTNGTGIALQPKPVAHRVLERAGCALIAAIVAACGSDAPSGRPQDEEEHDAADASTADVLSPDTPADTIGQTCGSELCSPSQACVYPSCCPHCSVPDGSTCVPGVPCEPPPGGCAAGETWGPCPVGGFASCVGPCVPIETPFCLDLACTSDPCNCDPDLVSRGCHDKGSCSRGSDGHVEVHCAECY
jgi:hypothetical protein